MKKICIFVLATVALASCSGSDETASTKFFLTADGTQRPFFAETSDDLDADGQQAVLVYADKTNEQITFDVAPTTTGDNLVSHVEFIPDVTDGTVYTMTDVFFSEITVNKAIRLKGSFSGNMTNGTIEKYVECSFDIRR